MTSPHEREERDFFDDLSDPAPPPDQPEPEQFAGGDAAPPEPFADTDPRATQTEMIRLADHLLPAYDRPPPAPAGGAPRERPRFAPPPRIGDGPTDRPAPEFRPPAPEGNGRTEIQRPPRRVEQPQFERPQFAPPSNGARGGRHGTPEWGERDHQGPDQWAQPQRWAEPSSQSQHRGEHRSGGELRDKLRATDLIAPRKIESRSGWRKALHTMSFGLINVGESADEQRVRALKAAVKDNVRGTYTVVVLGGKGGAGKTAMTAAVASIFADLRNDRVVAIDADPAQAANLATRVDGKAASMREINSDENLHRYADVRALAGQNAIGLDVVASTRHAAPRGEMLSAREFDDAHARLQRFYTVLFVDCGVDLDHQVMAGVLARANAILMVASAVPDGAEGASTNFDWLSEGGYHSLVSRTVLLINQIRPPHSRKDRKTTARLADTMTEHFKRWVPEQRIISVPFDPHLATAGIVELSQLSPITKRKALEAAAALATGFPTGAEGQ